MPDKDDNTISCEEIKRTLVRTYIYQDVFLKIIYFIVWTIMIVLMYLATVNIQSSRDNYFMIDGIIGTFESDFKKFELSNVVSHESFYQYVHQGLLSGITDEDVPGRMTENNQITVVQMKLIQNRVIKQKCKTNEFVTRAYANDSDSEEFLVNGEDDLTDRYPPFSKDVMSTETYGGEGLDPAIASAFKFSKLEYDFDIEGKSGEYPAEGFIVDLPLDVDSFEEVFDKLEEAKWLDDQTRVVTIAIVSYNYNIETYVLSMIAFEFNSGGGCYPSARHYPFRPRRRFYVCRSLQLYMSYTRVKKDENVNDKDSTNMKIPLPLKKYKPFYSIDDTNSSENNESENKVVKYAKRFWLVLTKPYWNLFILISLILYFIVIVWYYSISDRDVGDLDPNLLMDRVREYSEEQEYFLYLCGFTSFIGLLMLFNGLLFVSHVTVLWSTLFNGASHLISFTLMLIAIIYGFSCVAHSAYGNYIYNFSSTPRDFIILIDAAFSGLDFYELYSVHKNFSILFCVIFFFLVSVVLLNIFIAILCDSYNAAKFSEEEDEDEDNSVSVKSYEKGIARFLQEQIVSFVWKLKVAFYAYFGLAKDLENYYVKKFAKESDPISKNNFVFDYGMLIDWSLDDDENAEVSRFNGDELWDCIRNCGGKLSKFENYLANFLYVTNIVNDLKKKKEERHGDVDSEIYLLSPEFYLLCKLFSEKTGKNVDYKKYTEDCKKLELKKSIDPAKEIDYIRSPHFGYSDEKTKNGLIYCGRTFVPKNCLVYLKCGLLNGLPCENCRKKIRAIFKKYYGDVVFTMFDICIEEIRQRNCLSLSILERYRTLEEEEKVAEKKKYSSYLRKAGWVLSLKNLLLGGIQCDKCSSRYYSYYMPFICERVELKNEGNSAKIKSTMFTGKICAKCALEYMLKNPDKDKSVELKDIKEVTFSETSGEGKKGAGDNNKKPNKCQTRKGYKNDIIKKCNIVYKTLSEDERENLAMLFGVIDDKCKESDGKYKKNDDLLNDFYTCMTGSTECDELLGNLRKEFASESSLKSSPSGAISSSSSGVPLRPNTPAGPEGAGAEEDVDPAKFYEYIIEKYGYECKDLEEIEKDKEWSTAAKDFAGKYYRYEKIISIFIEYFKEKKKSCRDIFSDMTFNVIDYDKSGIIGLKEYRNYVKKLSGSSYSSLRADSEFKMFDTDKSNAIDIQEFREIFKIALYGFSDADPIFIFDQIDLNEDGKITYDEFIAYFEKAYPDYKKVDLVNAFKEATKEDNKREVPIIRRSIGFEKFKEFYDKNFGSDDDKKEPQPVNEDKVAEKKAGNEPAPANNDNPADDDDDNGKDEA